MRSLRLAGLTIRSLLTDTFIMRAAVLAVILVPLLYGALYLWAFWDPYGKLDQMPVAVVNLDRSVVVDHETIHAGDDLVKELVEGHDVGWRVVSAEEASAGLKARRYYLSLTIPADFSANLTTARSDHPRRAELRVVAQESTNMLASQIMSRVFAEVRAGAAESASRGYIDKMFLGFADAHDGLTEAALGAKDLRGGMALARNGALRLARGTTTAHTGARSLTSGLGALADGASQANAGARAVAAGSRSLASGLAKTDGGASRLSDGASKLSAGSGELSGAVGKLSGGADALASSADQLSDGAQQIDVGVTSALGELGDAKSGSAQVRDGAAGVSAALRAYASAHPDAASDPSFQQALGTADAVKAGSAQLADGLSSAAQQAPTLAAGADAVAGGAKQLAAGAEQLAAGSSQAYGASQQLAGAAGHLERGASALSSGVGSAHSGARTLATGSAKLAAGTSRLQSGTASAAGGASALTSGIGRLDEGARTLSSGLRPAIGGAEQLRSALASAANGVPDYSASLRSANAEMMSDPVAITTTRRGEVPTYGTGFTPYFVPLALWVGALVTFFILEPLPPRALAAAANPVVTALAGWLPGAALGVLQAVILVAVVQFGLGLKPVNHVATYAFAALTALVFAAILQMLNGAFGAVGKLVAIVLLMLQLTSAGGTFPTQMIPSFFQALNPFLPMSYVVTGMRQVVSGGDLATAAQCAVVLVAFGSAALGVTTLAARRKQMFTMERLHPSLSL